MELSPPTTTCRRLGRRSCHGGVQLAKKLFLPCRRDTWIWRRVVAIRLVEETEAHVVVGLLLLCRRNLVSRLLSRLILILQYRLTLLLLLLSGGGVRGTTSSGAAPPAAGAAPPPEPTFTSRSLTSLPSRALAKRVVQMGSMS